MSVAKPPREAVTLLSADLSKMSKNERIKVESKGLFYVSDGKGEVHTFVDEVKLLSAGSEPTISAAAKELSKFHGIYKQQARGERGTKTDDYFFMVRIKNPAGGALTAKQWAALDDAAQKFADGSLRLTSRQSIQYHHVYGPDLAPLMRHLGRNYRADGTLSACGDVNRNVMTSPIDALDPRHDCRASELANAIAADLAPRTPSYFEIWLSDDEGRKFASLAVDEPVYGSQYLPRKFKVGIAHPDDNSVDVLTQDVGLVPVVGAGHPDGEVWDLHTGGGLGMTHNNADTAPLLGLHLGRIRRAQVVEATRAIAILQKEHGERKDRRLARWKYTIRRLGTVFVKRALRERFGIALEDAAPVALPPMRLHLGWHAQRDGRSWYGVSVENGRVKPRLRRAIREAVETLGLSVRLTAQQDLLLCDVADRAALEAILAKHGIGAPESTSIVRRNAISCPAKPTCGLAMTEAEGILPAWIDAIEAAGHGDVDVMIRMTGCPNGCARPPTAEIGIYGYGKNDHVVLVGGARNGSRLAHVLYTRISGEQMVPALVGLFAAIKAHRPAGVAVDEFLHRTEPAQLRAWIGIDTVA
jgi:sulfite reductase (ferredoxin)